VLGCQRGKTRDTCQWNEQILHATFGKEDIDAILSIPLSWGLPEDKLIWKTTSHGRFTVNSAYRLIAEHEHKSAGESSRGNLMGPLWRAIWGVQLPNNIKVFTWRAMHNALSTRGNLEYRKIIPMVWCPLCGLQTKTILHTLWECDEVKGGWDASNIKVN
jgi:hypothetical protein